jgi:DNA-binding XRE family transcriptional regulator
VILKLKIYDYHTISGKNLIKEYLKSLPKEGFILPFIEVTETVLNEETVELEKAYNNDSKVRTTIDQFDAECKLRRKLVEVRKHHNLTQNQIKESTGLTQQVISRIEANTEISPSLKNLMIYADALGYELTLQPKSILCVSEEQVPYQ